MKTYLDVRKCRKLPLDKREEMFERIAGQLMKEFTIRTGIEVPQHFEPEVVEEFADENPAFGAVYDKIMEVREAFLGY